MSANSTNSDMLGKLDKVEIRFTEIESMLVDPAVTGDRNKFSELMREHADLAEIVEVFIRDGVNGHRRVADVTARIIPGTQVALQTLFGKGAVLHSTRVDMALSAGQVLPGDVGGQHAALRPALAVVPMAAATSGGLSG